MNNDRKENGVYLKHNGCNCCQAVILSYKDMLDLDEETLRKLGSSYGVGMGCMEATCGALIGATMVLGLLNDGSIGTMKKSKAILDRFKELSKDTICKNLKGIETGVVLTSCDDCVRNAIQSLDEFLGE
jgi:C_GCAxxG_C_C family probable redox protein